MSRSFEDRLLLTSLKFVKQKQYWQDKLSGIEELSGLRYFYDEKSEPEEGIRQQFSQVELELCAETCKGLMNLGKGSELTSYIILLTVLNVLLHRYSGHEDIVVWSPVFRPNAAEDTLNDRLAVRVAVEDGLTFKELLIRTGGAVQEAYENQDYPFDELGFSGLVSNVVCLLNNIHDRANIYSLQEQGALVFEFDLDTASSSVRGRLRFPEEDYEEEFMEKVAGHYASLLTLLVRDIDAGISSAPYLTESEKQQLLVDFNATDVSFEESRLLHQRFEDQVERTPGEVAIIAEGDRTYNWLNTRANRLARLLRANGVGPGVVTAVMVERSVEAIVAIYAVLKAGGTYLPVDPAYPDERIRAMLDGSGASVLLTLEPLLGTKQVSRQESGSDFQLLLLDRLEEELARLPGDNLECLICPDDLIYIIFTSGSTGNPKGAGVYQRGFMNLMHWFVTDYRLESSDRNLLMTSLSFDLTQKNVYAPLLKGGAICIPGIDYFEPRSLMMEIKEHGVGWINCTPSMFYKLVEYELDSRESYLGTLRYVFLGGEPISMKQVIRWLTSSECRAKLVNTYGPTECTDICAAFVVEDPRRYLEESVPVGKPVYNVQLFVTDRNLQPVPVGVPGELLIGGKGVGIGYVNDREMSGRKFIRRALVDGEEPRLLYRTGDRVRWRPDGTVEFLGRIDHQVKIRGFRIELEEIEHTLSSFEGIKEAAVVTISRDKDVDGSVDGMLCAYFVSSKAVEANELRDGLLRKLPQYMIPTHFIQLDALPMTPNGKLDRKALPDPGVEESGEAGVLEEPETQVEKIIAETWKEVLKIEQVGVNDNFFHVGGNSLEIGQLAGKLNDALDREIEFVTLFQFPTIRSLAQHLAAGADESSMQPVEVERKEEIHQGKNRLRQRINRTKQQP
jgi:amino acid adenylation domain-containing protein